MLIITALWNIWNERNGIREEGRWQGAEYIARSRKAYAAEAASLLKGAANTNAEEQEPVGSVGANLIWAASNSIAMTPFFLKPNRGAGAS